MGPRSAEALDKPNAPKKEQRPCFARMEGMIYGRLGKCFAGANDRKETVSCYLSAAQMYAHAGKWEKAVGFYEKAADISGDPRHIKDAADMLFFIDPQKAVMLYWNAGMQAHNKGTNISKEGEFFAREFGPNKRTIGSYLKASGFFELASDCYCKAGSVESLEIPKAAVFRNGADDAYRKAQALIAKAESLGTMIDFIDKGNAYMRRLPQKARSIARSGESQ